MKLTNADKENILATAQWMADNLTEHESIDWHAEKAMMSRTKLIFGFKKIYGMGLYHYLTMLRMKVVVSMLLYTDEQVNEIAKRVGYTNTGLNHVFFKAFNMTPTDYRVRHKNMTARTM
jgi:AraC-like DNA-binding protein